jgi:hypothetical protein
MAAPSFQVLLLTADARLARDVAFVCIERGHQVSRVEALADLHLALTGRDRPNVLLFDTDDRLEHGAQIAATVSAIHPNVAIVLAARGVERRSKNGFRLVDRMRAGERLVDELELACIGIPPSAEEWFGVGTAAVHPPRLP